MSHSNNIDTLRFVGAFMVLFGHTFELCYGPGGGLDPLSQITRRYTAFHETLPGLGVSMFFILSGYLVTRSFEQRPNFLAYLEARILRIYPAYWVVLILMVFLMGPLFTSLSVDDYFDHEGVWSYLSYNATLYPDVQYRLPGVFADNPRAGVNGSLWTLPVEVRMYVLVALVGLIGLLKSRRAFNLFAIALALWYLFHREHFFLLYKTEHLRLGLYFLLGAFFYVNRVALQYRLRWLLLVIGLSVLAHGSPFFNLVYAASFSYALLYLSFHQSLRLPNLSRYGDFSYGLYLYAFPVTQMCIVFLGSENPWMLVAIVFPLTLLFAIGSWYLVERPCIQRKGLLGSWIEKRLN